MPSDLLLPATEELLDGDNEWNGPGVVDGYELVVVLGLLGRPADYEGRRGVMVYHVHGSVCREPGDVGAVDIADLCLDLARPECQQQVMALLWPDLPLMTHELTPPERNRGMRLLLGRGSRQDCLWLLERAKEVADAGEER